MVEIKTLGCSTTYTCSVCTNKVGLLREREGVEIKTLDAAHRQHFFVSVHVVNVAHLPSSMSHSIGGVIGRPVPPRNSVPSRSNFECRPEGVQWHLPRDLGALERGRDTEMNLFIRQ